MSKLWVSEPRERSDRPGKWVVDVRRGAERHPRTFDTKEDAVAYADAVREEAEKLAASKGPKPRTLRALADLFLQQKTEEKLSEDTLSTYRGLIEQSLLPRLGPACLAEDIDLDRIEHYKKLRLKEGVSSTTVYRELDRLRALLELGKKQGVVETNILHSEDMVWPKLNEKVYDWLRSEEIGPFLDAACEAFATIARFTIFTGLRRREVVFLQRSDVDLNNGVILVRGKPEHGFRTKNGKERGVPIVDQLRPLLIKQLQLIGPRPDAWVFPRVDGQRRSEKTRYLAVSTHETAQRAGIDRPLTFHDLRRTFGAMLVEAGVGIYQVSHLLGHSDVRITQKVYAPLCAKHLAHEADKLGRYLGPKLMREVPKLPDEALASKAGAARGKKR